MKRIYGFYAIIAIVFLFWIHHELTESRFYAFSIGCEDYLPGDQCHKLAEKYINENPTWGIHD
jgi:hypothetical protein